MEILLHMDKYFLMFNVLLPVGSGFIILMPNKQTADCETKIFKFIKPQPTHLNFEIVNFLLGSGSLSGFSG